METTGLKGLCSRIYTYIYMGYIRIMEKKVETTINRTYIGVVEETLETTIE